MWSKTDSSHRKSAETSKETHPRPSLLHSPLHTPTRTVFVGWGDNNGSWRSRDRRLQTLTALCYVMNVWLLPPPPPPHLPTLHQYGATTLGKTSIALFMNRAMYATKVGKRRRYSCSVKQGVTCTNILWLNLSAPAVSVHICAACSMQKYFTLKGKFRSFHRSSLSRFCHIREEFGPASPGRGNTFKAMILLYFFMFLGTAKGVCQLEKKDMVHTTTPWSPIVFMTMRGRSPVTHDSIKRTNMDQACVNAF